MYDTYFATSISFHTGCCLGFDAGSCYGEASTAMGKENTASPSFSVASKVKF